MDLPVFLSLVATVVGIIGVATGGIGLLTRARSKEEHAECMSRNDSLERRCASLESTVEFEQRRGDRLEARVDLLRSDWLAQDLTPKIAATVAQVVREGWRGANGGS